MSVIGKEIAVGGDQGWTLGVKYDDITAVKGDVLVFIYPKNYHDVWLVDEANCEMSNMNGGYNVANPQQSPAKYILTQAGTFHFACLIPGHCGAGMLLTVNVSNEEADVQVDQSLNNSQEIQDAQDPGFCESPIANPDGTVTVNCQSAAIPLAPGDEVNANLLITIPYPPQHVILIDQHADLVDESGYPVPLSEVYVHHVFSFYTFTLPFTEGAEFRGIPSVAESTPMPYARLVDGSSLLAIKARQYVNFHLINTIGVDESEVKQCIECWCPRANPPTGRMSCCKNCNSTLTNEGPANYYYNYTVTYMPANITTVGDTDADNADGTPISEVYDINGQQRIPLDSVFLDMTGSRVEHDVQAAGPGQTSKLVRLYEFYSDCTGASRFGVVTCNAHQHIGGICIRAYVHETNELVCESCSQYGTEEGTVGNELGYLVGINSTVNDPPLMLEVGTKIRIESEYRADQEYLGLMSLMWVWTFAENVTTPGACSPVPYYEGVEIEPVELESGGLLSFRG